VVVLLPTLLMASNKFVATIEGVSPEAECDRMLQA